MTRPRALLLAAVCLILTFGTSPSAVLSITVGTNVNITQSGGSQAEATIAVNPSNTLQLFEANDPPQSDVSTQHRRWRDMDCGGGRRRRLLL